MPVLPRQHLGWYAAVENEVELNPACDAPAPLLLLGRTVWCDGLPRAGVSYVQDVAS